MRNSNRRERLPPCADVVVLGAGAAGLACAGALLSAGRRPLVLEARARVGGRIHTLHERGVALPVELGAEFVHGCPPELLAIARTAGLALCEAGGESLRRTSAGLSRSTRLAGRLAATFGRQHLTRDASVTQALAKSRASAAARAAAAAFVEGFDAAPPDEVSAQWVARSLAPGSDSTRRIMRFAGGYDGVVDWLHHATARGDTDVVRTCTLVTDVEWEPGRVRVRCASPTGLRLDTIEAEQLVVTLPVGVLQAPPGAAGAVRFDPPLPRSHQRALGLLAMGHVVRLTLRFRDPPWPAGLGFLQAPGEPVPVWWTARPFDEPRIVGWCGGRLAARLLPLGEAGVLEGGLASLSRALGVARARVERELAAWWLHDWSADPFTRGAYAFARVGGALAGPSLSSPIRGTIFFAGEATSPAAEAGTVHGAIASGRRAARRILVARPSPRPHSRAGQ
jgi:monoamine oxidase